MRYCAFMAVMLLVAGFAFGADVDGKWTATMQDMTLGYEFKAEGTTLTGTHTGPEGNVVPIKDGKIDGNNISFAYDSDGYGGMKMSFKYTGVLSGNVLKLSYITDMGGGFGGPDGGPPAVSFIAKRVL